MSATAAKFTTESRRSVPAAVSDENQSVWGLPSVSGYLTRAVDDDDDAKQPNGRGLSSRKTGCLQPLQSNDDGSLSQGLFYRSMSSDSELSDADFDLRPLIKEELRNSIQKRRWQSGTLDWGLEDYDKKRCRDNKLTPEELSKREERKVRNRQAAAKCREKRRMRMEELQQTMNTLESRQSELMQQKQTLHQEKLQLERMVDDHFRLCRRKMSLRGT